MYRETVFESSAEHSWPLESTDHLHGGFDSETAEELPGEHLNLFGGSTLVGPGEFAGDGVLSDQADSLYLTLDEFLEADDPDVGKLGTGTTWGFYVWVDLDDPTALTELAGNGGWVLHASDSEVVLELGSTPVTVTASTGLSPGVNQVGFIMGNPVTMLLNGQVVASTPSGSLPGNITTMAGSLRVGQGVEGVIAYPTLLGTAVTAAEIGEHYQIGSNGFNVVSFPVVDSIAIDDGDIESYEPIGQVTIISFGP